MTTWVHEGSSRGAWDWQKVRALCLRTAHRYTRDTQDAEDVAQEAALRAWRARGGLRDGMRRDEWLGRITRNEAMRLHERRARDRTAAAPATAGAALDPALLEIVEGAPVRTAVAALTPPERELLGLRYEDDLTQPAIAERLGVPEGTIKVRLHRARAKLKLALAEQ